MPYREVTTKDNPKIPTRNKEGEKNGFLIPIINILDGFIDPEEWPKQVYCTVASPGEIKGPHLHKERYGLFTCIRGNIKIVTREDGDYKEYFSGEDHSFRTIYVPAGIPSALVNISREDAYILNMPCPSWSAENPDDWPVTFDGYSFE